MCENLDVFWLALMEPKTDDNWDEILNDFDFSQEICAQIAMYYFLGNCYQERDIEKGIEERVYAVFQKHCSEFEYYIGNIWYTEKTGKKGVPRLTFILSKEIN